MPLCWPVLLWLQEETVQDTLGSQKDPWHHPPPYGSALFLAQSEWSRIHPRVLKGKFSPWVQHESIPIGVISLEKDHLKLWE